jgi:protease-4
MAERPPLLNDLFRMVVKMIVGGIVLIGLVSCGVVGLAGAGAAAGGGSAKIAKPKTTETLYGKDESANSIVQIDIKGPILTHRPKEDAGFFSALSSVTYGYEVKEQLLEAAKDDSIKGVMLFVTTPGGSIVGSQAIHDGVLAVKAAGKPVVAYVDTISASGGVWSTAGADKIFADYGSLIGSVGVNFGNWFYYEDPIALDGGILGGGVETRGGVRTSFVGAGLGKDLGNPFRPMTDREKALLNETADYFYQAFLDHVVKYRKMDRQKLIDDYGAMIFGNAGAQERGYIDGTKTFEETIGFIAELAGVKGDDWKLVSPPAEKKSPFEQMFGALAVSFTGDRAAAVQNHRVCEELKGRPIAMSVKALTDLCGG